MVPIFPAEQRSPKRSPKRKVLHERSRSQANKVPQRIGTTGAKQESNPSTPFPTKPAHILLPSSIRSRNGSGGISGASFAARVTQGKDKVAGAENRLEVPVTTSAETLGIKRSVSELRDLYEGQTASRPSTSHSTRPPSRSVTPLSSPALRGQVLGERLTGNGRYLPFESDETVVLPSPRDTSFSIKKVVSEASLPPLPPTPPDSSIRDEFPIDNSIATSDQPLIFSSSPNLIAFGSSSSAPEGSAVNSSSPNFVLLGRSSSRDLTSEIHISSDNIVPIQLASSPILNPIAPSSPSAVQSERPSSIRSESAATSSSPNVVTLGSSSPNYVTTKYDDSPDASPDSLRTIKKRRSETVHEQPSTSTFSTSSEQFSSSPPNPGKSATSASSLGLPMPPESQTKPALLNESGRLRAHENLQTAIESSPAPEIQYPVIAAPSMNPWEDLNVQKRAPRQLPEDPSPTRWNPHVSTVPSEWSDENPLGSCRSLDTADLSDTDSIPGMPQAAHTDHGNITSSTTNMIPEADRHEATDIISDLRSPYLHSKPSGFISVLSGSSRSNSMRSIILRRPNSSSSLSSTVRFPAWARRYYSIGPSDSFYSLRPETSSSNLSQVSPPATAVPSRVERASSHGFFRPRTRAGKNARESHLLPGIGPLVSNPSQPSLLRVSSLPLDPADPRAHWAGAEHAAMEAELQNRPPVGSRMLNQWSPHLYPDNRASERNHWLAPSIDENGAPIFAWRNAHMVGFMVGFIFPISWFAAAFLPLPPRPAMKEVLYDPESLGPTLQEQLDHRATLAQETRYANLRWWRHLNRFMCIVGLVVVAIIVSTASI
jgi:hypothetical protein